MIGDDDGVLNSFRNREVDVLLMELKVLVNELNANEITKEEYARRRDVIIDKLTNENR